jgi:hypothetical protein
MSVHEFLEEVAADHERDDRVLERSDAPEFTLSDTRPTPTINMDKLRHVVASGQNINALHPLYQINLLGYACKAGDVEAIDFLLSHGAQRPPYCSLLTLLTSDRVRRARRLTPTQMHQALDRLAPLADAEDVTGAMENVLLHDDLGFEHMRVLMDAPAAAYGPQVFVPRQEFYSASAQEKFVRALGYDTRLTPENLDALATLHRAWMPSVLQRALAFESRVRHRWSLLRSAWVHVVVEVAARCAKVP